MLDTILQYDKELLIYLNNLGNKQWDGFWLVITNQFSWIPLFIFILFLVFKKKTTKQGLVLLLVIAIMITFSDQFTNMIRGIFERLRPINDESVNLYLREKLISSKSFSFTSGHATSSTTFAVFIYQILKQYYPKYIKLIFIFPLIFAYSRIYLGVHYPVDITVGAINGTIIGYVFSILYKKIEARF